MRVRFTPSVCVCITFLYWSGTADLSAQEVGDQIVVTSSDARLLAGDRDLGEVHWLAFLSVLDINGEWYWVEHEGQKGWINRKHVATLREAIDVFDEEPSEKWRHVALARTYDQMGDYAAAIPHYSELHELEPGSTQWLFSRGTCRYFLGDIDAAIKDLEVLVRIDPRDETTYLFLSLCWQSRGDYVRAVACQNSRLELQPDNANALVSRSGIHAAFGNLQAALDDCQAALAISKDDLSVHYQFSSVYLALGDLEAALQSIDRAVEIDPESAYTRSQRGVIYWRIGDADKSIAELTRAIDQWEAESPALAVNALLVRSKAYASIGESDLALADANRAVELGPQPSVLCNRAEVYCGVGKYALAAADFEAAYESDPFDANTLNSFAWFLATCEEAKYRDGPRAVELSELVCQLTSWSHSQYVDTLAAAYAEVGDFERARLWQGHAAAFADEAEREDYLSRLAIYQKGSPYRDGEAAPAAPETAP